jgi:hypothetical protein
MMTATRRFIVQPQHKLAANMTQEGKKNQEETTKRSKAGAHRNNKTSPVKSRQAVSCAFLHLHMTTKKAHSLRRYYPDQVLRVYLSLL